MSKTDEHRGLTPEQEAAVVETATRVLRGYLAPEDRHLASEAARAAIAAHTQALDGATGWRPIETAPKDGRPFLARQDGEVFVARYTKEAVQRLCFRTHSLRVMSKYRIVNAELDGAQVKAQVPVDEPWTEVFEHNWTLWTKGFEFSPTEWIEMPGSSPPQRDDAGVR